MCYRRAVRFTVSHVARELDLSRARIHQLLAELLIKPEVIEGPDGRVIAYLLTADDVQRLRDRPIGRAGRPRKEKSDE